MPRKHSRTRCAPDPLSLPSNSSRFVLYLEAERDRALAGANERRAEARQLEIAGNEEAGSILRALARVLDDSVRFWQTEIDHAKARTE